MGQKVLITKRDMMRALTEFAETNSSGGEWMESEGIDPECISLVSIIIQGSIKTALLLDDFDPEEDDVVTSIIGTAFQMGWEAHKQFRSEHSS